MHPEDRMILSPKLSEAKITNDIWFAVEQGFIPASDMSKISNNYNYDESLIGLFREWYETKAVPEQRLLVDLNGYLHLNDQFNDFKTIAALSIENKITDYESESIAPDESELNLIPVDDIQELRNNLSDEPGNVRTINLSDLCTSEFDSIKCWESENFSDNFPIHKKSDLDNNTNIVYILNCMNRENWKVLVNGIFFRLKNQDYNGISIKDALDWLIHYHEINKLKDAEFSKKLMERYENDEDWQDDIQEDRAEKKSLLGKKLKLKKNKEIGYAKKAIKRGLKLLESFIPSEDINLFTSKEGFIVEGDMFNYRFRKGHTSIISHTLNPISYHIPYDLIVLNKDNVELANLCIYFDETPIIDQIVSTILHLKSSEEQKILSTGNFYNKRKEFYTDPLISKNFHTELNDDESSLLYETENFKEERDYELFEKIEGCVFKALPNFLGLDLPEFVYRDFSNITFDSMIDNYYRNGEINAPHLTSYFSLKIENKKVETEVGI